MGVQRQAGPHGRLSLHARVLLLLLRAHLPTHAAPLTARAAGAATGPATVFAASDEPPNPVAGADGGDAALLDDLLRRLTPFLVYAL